MSDNVRQLDLGLDLGLDPEPGLGGALGLGGDARVNELGGSGVIVARGTRATQESLLGWLAAHEARCEPFDLAESRRRLARPIRIVVPSRSLREHLCARIVRRFDRSVAGVSVQTLAGVVETILGRAGLGDDTPESASDAWAFPVRVRKLAQRESALRRPLDSLVDGYGSVIAGVSDLLDAGFEPPHTDALLERLAELDDPATARRAAALVRVAAAVANDAGCERGHVSADIRRAREILEGHPDPERALPARAVALIGFADATGAQTDFIDALVRLRGARVWIDHPPDPSDASRTDAGVAYTRRFTERLGLAADSDSLAGPASLPRRVEVLHAPSRGAELRAVAEQIRSLLDRGVVAETIAVVARDLAPYRAVARMHFLRLGIPFSGLSEVGSATPLQRRLAALQSIVREGARATLETLLDAMVLLPAVPGAPAVPIDAGLRADLRTACHAVGAARIGQAAELGRAAPGKGGGRGGDAAPILLPVRSGLAARDASHEGGSRRSLPARRWNALVAAAAEVVRIDREAPMRAPLTAHRRALARLVSGPLGWSDPEDAALRELADRVEQRSDPGVTLDRSDWWLLLQGWLETAGWTPLGGEGGGVAVLSAMEARERVHEHLFVVGLHRDEFPRPISEDPLLPDPVRRSLRVVLPDLPVKREAVDEERYLFAQLFSSSPDVVLSCAVIDAAGRRRPVSPLLDRLTGCEPVAVREPWTAAHDATSVARTPLERAIRVGLHADRRRFQAALAAALEAGRSPGAEPPVPAAAVASARVASLSEWDALGGDPGPFGGFVGEPTDSSDPRHGPLFVTWLEGLSACPWATFLERLLRVEATPDSLAALPAVEPRMVGSVVHRVLQAIAIPHLDQRPPHLVQRPPHLVQRPPHFVQRPPHLAQDLPEAAVAAGFEAVSIPWPDSAALDAQLREAAEEVAHEEGIWVPGFGRVLAGAARATLESAASTWPVAPWGVLAVEAPGEVRVANAAGEARSLHFVADRVDASPHGVRLVDYKTGRPLGVQQSEARRRAALERAVASGRSLQAIAYALGGPAHTTAPSIGEYVYLRPDVPDHARSLVASADDAPLEESFRKATATLIEAREAGSFFPRLVDGSGDAEPRRCRACSVKEACLRGDSAARHRQRRWIENADAAPGEPSHSARHARGSQAHRSERALLALWQLGGDG